MSARMKLPPHPRFLAFLAVLIAGTGMLATSLRFELALVSAFDAASLMFLGSCLPLWREKGAAAARNRAARDDGGQGLLALVAAATLIAVFAALGRLVMARETLGWADIGPIVATFVLAWAFANMIYAFHYDRLYHTQVAGGDRGGLEFPGTRDPVFADFCYLSFTIGMTCQTSDVTIHTAELRRIVLVQGLLSYLFNLGVLAMVINLLAGVL